MNELINGLPPGLNVLPRYAVAIALGLLMGLERERNPAALAGLRTFALTALFGTLAAHLASLSTQPWLIAIGLLLTGGMMIAAYMHPVADRDDPGTTTVAALLLCYGLGVLIWFNEIQLAVILAIATTTLLYFKPELRGISERLSRKDLLSILQFALLSLIILPLLPDKNYGPYGALNPYQIWWVVVLTVGVGLAGYAALRLMGKRGVIVVGLLGGMVSSTATTLAFSRHARRDEAMARIAVIVIVLANLVVLVRLGVLAAIIAPTIVSALYPILAGGLVVGGIGAWYGFRRLNPQGVGGGGKDAEASTTTLHPQGAGRGGKVAEASTTTLNPQGTMPELAVANPTELRPALGFAALYAVILLISAWLSDVIGNTALYAVALVSGLTDIDPITLSTLRLFNLGKVPSFNVINVIILAILANLAFKTTLALSLGGWAKMRHAAAGMGAMALGLILAWLIIAGF